MLANVLPADQLRSLVSRKAKSDEFKSVRHPLVEEEIANGWVVQRRNRTSTRLQKPKTHDKNFEDRVWTLLYRMGFQHLSSQGGGYLLVNADEPKGPDNQIDVVAIDDDVAFAIECKSCERPKKLADFSKDLAKHVGMRDRFTRAVRDQVPSANKRPSIFAFWTSGIVISDNDKARALADRVPLLDEKDLEYYEQLVSQIGSDLHDSELVDVMKPWAKKIGGYFALFTPQQMIQFRALRGVQGQTTGTRRVEEVIRLAEPTFNPPGLKEFLEREKAQTTTRAFEEIQAIEQILQTTVLTELKSEFGLDENDWWFGGVPKGVRKKVDDRINEEAGKKGGREQNFDLIDYREIIHANWQLFEASLAQGKGSKENKTKWIVEVNDLRKPVMHASRGQSLPITEEQLALLEEIREWLKAQVGEQPAELS